LGFGSSNRASKARIELPGSELGQCRNGLGSVRAFEHWFYLAKLELRKLELRVTVTANRWKGDKEGEISACITNMLLCNL
jgi:hypothetical protein